MKANLPGLLVQVLTTTIASAGTPAEIPLQTPTAPDWQFRTSLYGWLTGLDGTTGVGGLTAEVDESFIDILPNLKMAAALQFEARYQRWGILTDGMYVNLGSSGPTPGPIYDHVDVGIKQFTGEVSLAYRVYESLSGFVDLYAGVRYNSLSVDFEGALDPAGVQSVSDNASEHVVDGMRARADAIAQPRIAEFQAGTAAERTVIEDQLTADIEAEADGRVKRDLSKQLLKIRHEGGLDARDIAAAKINIAVKSQRLQLARSAAKLEVAKLRATVDSSAQGAVTKARSRVQQAEDNLAAAINKQLVSKVPTEASARQDWLDPIVGVRAQWNVSEKCFLAGKTDIGGFGVGSDLAWTLQATVGYNFTKNVSSEIGYRYMHTDYSDGAFTYDVAQGGLFTSLNFKF